MKRVDLFFIQNVSIFVAESGPQIFSGTTQETPWFFHWIWPLTFFKPFTVWNLLAAERWKPTFQTVCFRCDPVLLTPRFSTKTTKKKSHEKKNVIKHHSSRYNFEFWGPNINSLLYTWTNWWVIFFTLHLHMELWAHHLGWFGQGLGVILPTSPSPHLWERWPPWADWLSFRKNPPNGVPWNHEISGKFTS